MPDVDYGMLWRVNYGSDSFAVITPRGWDAGAVRIWFSQHFPEWPDFTIDYARTAYLAEMGTTRTIHVPVPEKPNGS
jgi:hypothetical protein